MSDNEPAPDTRHESAEQRSTDLGVMGLWRVCDSLVFLLHVASENATDADDLRRINSAHEAAVECSVRIGQAFLREDNREASAVVLPHAVAKTLAARAAFVQRRIEEQRKAEAGEQDGGPKIPDLPPDTTIQ